LSVRRYLDLMPATTPNNSSSAPLAW